MHKGGCVYILTNKNNTTLYTGVTSDLNKRIWQHKSTYNPFSFTAKYKLTKLVYYQFYITINEAILVEKQIKAGSRAKKENLINSINPEWEDLYEKIEW
ncbi:MAG: GIY-YIG nuclease family protein [Bacteroidetes bacterium]|nr:GIY-YIG nuclease family protein [Bacteroidota bacterium]